MVVETAPEDLNGQPTLKNDDGDAYDDEKNFERIHDLLHRFDLPSRRGVIPQRAKKTPSAMRAIGTKNQITDGLVIGCSSLAIAGVPLLLPTGLVWVGFR